MLSEKGINTILNIAIGIIVGTVLLIGIVLETIAKPFDDLANFFNENELSEIQELQIEYGYLQNTSLNSSDYNKGLDLDYSEVEFIQGQTQVAYFNQLDSRWANLNYGKTSTIGEAGCGPTALSMVVSTLTSKIVDPIEMSSWAYSNNYYAEGQGSYHSLIPQGAEAFGLSVEKNTTEPQQIVEALAEGKLIIAIMSKGHFTNTGHFIVLRGVTEDGKILVADPASKKRSEIEWDLNIILNEARNNAGAGGPFWIIGN